MVLAVRQRVQDSFITLLKVMFFESDGVLKIYNSFYTK